MHQSTPLAEPGLLPDADLVDRARERDEAAIRVLTRRHNRRLYRIARSILRNNNEAEDVVQETYLRAFTRLDTFRAESSFATWITRIAMNEALGRVRRRRTEIDWHAASENQIQAEVIQFPSTVSDGDPERSMARREIRGLLEKAIDNLPDGFRTVFVARIVEGLSIEETAASLELRPETVKTRLHRARLMLRETLDEQVDTALAETFPFAGLRCQRLTEAVLHRLAENR
jgi:RNA polymerase sigma-70 factor (ECF subfamily)